MVFKNEEFTLMNKVLKGNEGFTLIEILVTIAIIAITAFVTIPSLKNLNQS